MISITLKNLALRSAQKEGYIKRTFNNMPCGSVPHNSEDA